MTAIAGLAGDKVAVGLTRGETAVVTAVAGAVDLIVIDPSHRLPCAVAMASLANVRGRWVPGTLTVRDITVVTAVATGGYVAVVEIGRSPTAGAVAEIAGIVAGDMILRLALRDGAIVAAGADTDDFVVIDPHRR